jgi:hypothetical protein
MNFLIRIFFCILLLGLFACVSKNSLRGQEIAQCNMTCIKHFEFCRQNCVDNCPNCSWKSTQQSAVNFAKYVNERAVQGKKVMRELNSYRDPLQCRKVTCNCMADLVACKQSCSGVIHKRLQAIPNCV